MGILFSIIVAVSAYYSHDLPWLIIGCVLLLIDLMDYHARDIKAHIDTRFEKLEEE